MDTSQEANLAEDDSIFNDFANIAPVNLSSDALVEDSFSSVVVTSTPAKDGRSQSSSAGVGSRGRGRGRGASSSKSRETATKGPASSTHKRLPCDQCANTYANERTLATHKKMHFMKGLSSRCTSEEELKDNMKVLLEETLMCMVQEGTVGVIASEVNAYSASVKDLLTGQEELFGFLSSAFYKILKNQNALVPSAVRSNMYISTNKLLSCNDFRLKLKDHFLKVKEVSPEILNVFLGGMMMLLSKKIVLFYLKKLREAASTNFEVRQKRSLDDITSEDFMQLVYHIGGSVVAGLLWKGDACKESDHQWFCFVNALRSKFLRDEGGENACAQHVSAFTDTQDRGGLKHLSQDAFDFFLLMFDLIMSLEGSEGSLPQDVVDNGVLTSDTLLCLWDVLVCEHLNEEQSIDLLLQMSKCCKKVVVKGILKRRLNAELLKAYASVPLRSNLSR